MSDIIANAKQLLDEATPAPWELYGGEIHHIQHTPEQCTSFRCDHRWPVLSESWGESAAVAAEDEDLALMAAAPEMAQALAAERYEYCVQMWMGIKWLSLGQGYGMFSIESRGIWWDTRDKAQDFMDKCETEHSLRIVRRRVSPPEVASE